jgi:hypothetical protein
MKNLRVFFTAALILALIPSVPLFAGEDNERRGSAAALRGTYHVSHFTMDLDDGKETSGFLKSAEIGGVHAEPVKYPSALAGEIRADLMPAHKVQMDPPRLDLLKTKFEGPNLMEEKVGTAGQVTEVKILGYDETKMKGIQGDGASDLLRARASANEASALSSLKTLVSSNKMFYQGDVDVEEGAVHSPKTTGSASMMDQGGMKDPSQEDSAASSGNDEDDGK